MLDFSCERWFSCDFTLAAERKLANCDLCFVVAGKILGWFYLLINGLVSESSFLFCVVLNKN